MASGTVLQSTNNSTMTLRYSGTDGQAKVIEVPSTSGTMATESQLLGVGQTWQDMSASRALGQTYTNNTGKPISVHVWLSNTIGEAGINVDINGVAMFGSICLATTKYGGITFIVPNNTSYKVYTTIGVSTVSLWSELR